MAERAKHRPNYDIQKQPEGYSSSIIWSFGDDQFTRQLSQRLGFLPSQDELDFTREITRRDPLVLDKITEIWGRSAKINALHVESILETQYDTLEVGGFGYQPMKALGGASGEVDFHSQIVIPSAQNFVDIHPRVTQTNVLDQGKEIQLGDPFSFTGAYTRKQAARKVAANLFILNKLSNMNPAPFVVPIPIAIGNYPSVVNSSGEPAYFIVFKVPYEGKRTGQRLIMGGDVEAYQQYGQDLIESLPGIASTLALISNKWGLTHNQPHPANLYIPNKDEGTKPYLADFSTMYPLHPRKQEAARARELARGMSAIWDIFKTQFKGSQEAPIVNYIFSNILNNYLGLRIPGGPTSFNTTEHFFEAAIRVAIDKGLIPKELPHQESWEKILSLEKNILKMLKTSH